MDHGDIWDTRNFMFEQKRKSSLYNQEVADAANDALLESTSRFFSGSYTPLPLDYLQPDVKGKLMPAIKKKDRAIDWENHTSQ
jgi:putative two-component system protein, hydrogenase maturation factor HypX/HoxX